MNDARLHAERAARQRLLNCYLRESGRSMTATGDGLARVRLTAPGTALVVELRHRSVFGHHAYGDETWLERPGEPRLSLANREFMTLVLAEVEVVAAHAFPGIDGGARRSAELIAHINGSIGATARYLRHDRLAHHGDAQSLTRTAEQSLVYGHPFHPTPKSIEGFGDELPRYAPELGASFRLHYFAVHPDAVLQRRVAPGPWLPPDVVDAVRGRPGIDGYELLPVHPWQANYLLRQPRVTDLVREGTLVALGELGEPVYPTSSVRTVCDPSFPTSWKLPLHVRITNFVRNNPVEHLRRAADAGALVAQLAPRWRHRGFAVLAETGFRGVDPARVGQDLAADFAVVYRENPFADGRYAPRVVASLLEERVGGAPDLIAEVRRSAGAGGVTPEHVGQWLRRYLRISLLPLLDVFGSDGVSFEAHVQNSLLHTEDGWPARFWVRDMEGTSVSRDRLRNCELAPDSPLLYDDEEAWRRLRYHAVSNHLGHLVAVLGRFTDADEARLWRVARECLLHAGGERAEALINSPVLPAKANLVSRFARRGEQPLYVDVPNPLFEVSR
ncbi:MAG: IucA/IucC family siderophore biosynthesis protein [Actinophytocola sp.]|nr:IucA/IucC family siderophore biosynthesis protein [Actinophytocola sp.]